MITKGELFRMFESLLIAELVEIRNPGLTVIRHTTYEAFAAAGAAWAEAQNTPKIDVPTINVDTTAAESIRSAIRRHRTSKPTLPGVPSDSWAHETRESLERIWRESTPAKIGRKTTRQSRTKAPDAPIASLPHPAINPAWIAAWNAAHDSSLNGHKARIAIWGTAYSSNTPAWKGIAS